jgi:hypothetical protein
VASTPCCLTVPCVRESVRHCLYNGVDDYYARLYKLSSTGTRQWFKNAATMSVSYYCSEPSGWHPLRTRRRYRQLRQRLRRNWYQ